MGGGEAELVYGDGEFHVVRPGAYVVCAVTGARVSLDELRYWNVDRREAYASAEVSLKRYIEVARRIMKRTSVVLAVLLLVLPGLAAAESGPNLELQGPMKQGSLVIGMAAPGARATLDGAALPVAESGLFAFGFDRDHGPAARLVLSYPDGTSIEQQARVCAARMGDQRIDGLPQKYVTPPPETLARIATERELKPCGARSRASAALHGLRCVASVLSHVPRSAPPASLGPPQLRLSWRARSAMCGVDCRRAVRHADLCGRRGDWRSDALSRAGSALLRITAMA